MDRKRKLSGSTLTKTVSFEDSAEEEFPLEDERRVLTARVDWPQHFMAIALTASLRSKDPDTRVGCCIVDPSTFKIINTAYNGFPPGMEDIAEKWDKKKKKLYVIHAEANALVRSNADVRGAVCFVTLFPCIECAKLLAQAGIKEVVYLSYRDKYAEAREIFKHAGVKVSYFAQSGGDREKFMKNLKEELDNTLAGLAKREPEGQDFSAWPGTDLSKDYIGGQSENHPSPWRSSSHSPHKRPSNVVHNLSKRFREPDSDGQTKDEDATEGQS